MAEQERPTAVELPAAAVLGRGRAAAFGLLVLRVLRTGSITLVALGIVVAAAVGRLQEASTAELATIAGLAHSLVTPLAVLAAGIVLRFLIGPVALLLAAVTVGTTRVAVRPTRERRGRFAHWRDRYRAAAGYQSLRWSVAVKHEAVDRLGPAGSALALLEVALWVLTGLCVVALPVVVWLRSA